MTKTNGKDNAFPQHVEFPLHPNSTMEYGLTKREIFAMAAMQGMCAQFGHGKSGDYANRAVEYADALIESLNKETK